MRRAVIVAAFVVFALLSLLIAPVFVEAVRYGDLSTTEAIRSAAIFVPTVVLGWFAWRHVGPLPAATQERLVAVFDKMAASPSALGVSRPVFQWDRDLTIASMRMRSPVAARRFFRPDPHMGFQALLRDAEVADEKGLLTAPDRWRDLGVLMTGLDDPLAHTALNKALRAGRDDYLVRVALYHFNESIDDWTDARNHAEAALEKAGDETQRLNALSLLEVACIRLGDWRAVGETSKRIGLSMRTGDDVDPDVLINYARILEDNAAKILQGDGAATAKPAFDESLALRTAAAKQLGTYAAQHAVVAAYDRVGGLLAKAAGEATGKPYRDWARALEAKIPEEHGHDHG